MTIEIEKSGLLTTIQDNGRYGFRKYGVIVSGAMDPIAMRISNILVGNEEDSSVLESTLIGPNIKINEDCLISICGGDLSPKINGINAPMWRPIYIKSGSVLSFTGCKLGARAYISFSGSFNLDKTLGSNSTYIRASIGGIEGRALKNGDVINLNTPTTIGVKIINKLKKNIDEKGFSSTSWFIGKNFICNYSSAPILRFTKGVQFHCFTDKSIKDFCNNKFKITLQSDRMGYRLNGPQLYLKEPLELISEAVTLGTVQVPKDGNPIILLADGQTTGGYPKIADIASIDIPIAAQLKPGDKITFREISLEEAQRLYILREKKLKYLKNLINFKFD
ncbi:biotin-dependent carboxyltransferase family protein [Clostridium sp. Marseille-Q2269]|uniref:5-oxoprolinase subunit C family protein n=1 Tax=Clostridium sp. Marseille-Q2269 TaxID=2942205 RepID=UPI00207470DE|nr:biotin-dependent carboxyltransferase family protein [Clostridium sp. Marseille-Q2269]